MLHGLLRAEGLVQNAKRIYRIYREEGLQVRTKRRKKLQRPRVPMAVPNRVHECRSTDFVSEQMANGRRFRVLNIVDDLSCECVLQITDFSISGKFLAKFELHLEDMASSKMKERKNQRGQTRLTTPASRKHTASSST
ncbi:MAG TPA: transposase [Gammaproteobacteria bacterium]|nr:transposase [Gammaproteobacteria bacterium]